MLTLSFSPILLSIYSTLVEIVPFQSKSNLIEIWYSLLEQQKSWEELNYFCGKEKQTHVLFFLRWLLRVLWQIFRLPTGHIQLQVFGLRKNSWTRKLSHNNSDRCEISSFGESPICKNCEHNELSNLVPLNHKNYRLYPHLIQILLDLSTKELYEQNRTIISIINRISMYSTPNT